MREHSAVSCIGLVTLFLAIANFVFSIAYVRNYIIYTRAVEAYGMDSLDCELPGAWVMFTYCALSQLPFGALCCLMYSMSCMVKSCHAVSFACPGITTKFKKCWHGHPSQFGHYEGEFDFECGNESPRCADIEPHSRKGLLGQQEQAYLGPADLGRDPNG